jgi:hypothetical protein
MENMIDTDTIDGKIEVMRAFERGETILQGRRSRMNSFIDYEECYHPTWNWKYADYQIAPKQAQKKTVTLYQAIFINNYRKCWISDKLFESAQDAESYLGKDGFVRLLTENPIEVEIDV